MADSPADPSLEPVGGQVSPIPRAARPFQGQTAGIVTRLVAAVLDMVVVGAVMVGLYAGLVGVIFFLGPRSFHFPEPSLLLSLTTAFAIAFLYLTGAWAWSGRTYGDLVMGLRVISRRGRPLRLPRAAARAALVVLFPIGLVWVPVGRNNRSVQDLLLGTQVVYDWQPRAARASVESPRP